MVRNFLALCVGAAVAWHYGIGLALTTFAGDFWWLGFAIPFVIGYVLTSAILGVLFGILARALKISGGGIWQASPVRWLVGQTTIACLYAFSAFVFGVLVPRIYPDTPMWILILLVIGSLPVSAYFLKIWGGRASRPFRYVWRSLYVGVGGSSRFAGIWEEWANEWRPGYVFLGNSLYDPKWRVGKRDDRHFITIATSRSGKGRSGIIPNLLTWPGSALIIDPKGENAAVTAPPRARKGQAVRIVDPFEVLKRIGLGEIGYWKEVRDPYRTYRFNPLAEIDLKALDVVEQIREITEALVIPSAKTNPFFDDAAKKILSGVIAHVLTSDKIKPADRHLGTVRDYLIEVNGRKRTEMIGNMAAGGLAAAAASALATGSEGASGDVLFTAQVHTEWLDSVAMRHTLSGSEFLLSELKEKDTSIYLVLPGDYIDLHSRFLRLFVNLTLRAASKGKKSQYPILFLLDEFYSLGTLPLLASAAGLMAGFGVKLWPILQNLGQLRDRYPESWETFLGNAGMWQVFAVNDQTTARYLSERLGHHVTWRKVQTGRGTEWEPAGTTWLRTSVELARESSRESGKQLVFTEGGDTFLLRRSPYDWMFKPDEYCPNPYEPDTPSLWKLIRVNADQQAFEGWLIRKLARVIPYFARHLAWLENFERESQRVMKQRAQEEARQQALEQVRQQAEKQAQEASQAPAMAMGGVAVALDHPGPQHDPEPPRPTRRRARSKASKESTA